MAELMIYNTNMQDDIEEFYKKVFEDLGWKFEPNGRHFDIVNIPNEYMKNGCFWCLYETNKLIGTVAIRMIDFENKTAELKRLYVLSEEQGKGYGDLLFGIAVKFAKDNKFNKICADTRNDRNASQHLMRKFGFHEVPKYNSNDFAELFFELELH